MERLIYVCLWAVLLGTDACEQPRVVGKCRGYFPRYFYNATSKTCQRFVYGGCGGNLNNFESSKQCNQYCLHEVVCHQPKRTGQCEAHMLRFYYDTEKNSCQQFVYGGCDGNDNNFELKAQCQQSCMKDTDGAPGLRVEMLATVLAVITGWCFSSRR